MHAPGFDWSLISIAINVVLGLVMFYVGAKIRIAILELEGRIAEKYATKGEVEKQIDLAGRIDQGFSRTHAQLRGIAEARPR